MSRLYWTSERVALAKRLKLDGHSYPEIAARPEFKYTTAAAMRAAICRRGLTSSRDAMRSPIPGAVRPAFLAAADARGLTMAETLRRVLTACDVTLIDNILDDGVVTPLAA